MLEKLALISHWLQHIHEDNMFEDTSQRVGIKRAKHEKDQSNRINAL